MRHGIHPMVMKRSSTKDRNADSNRWFSNLRTPYEGTFSKQNKLKQGSIASFCPVTGINQAVFGAFLQIICRVCTDLLVFVWNLLFFSIPMLCRESFLRSIYLSLFTITIYKFFCEFYHKVMGFRIAFTIYK